VNSLKNYLISTILIIVCFNTNGFTNERKIKKYNLWSLLYHKKSQNPYSSLKKYLNSINEKIALDLTTYSSYEDKVIDYDKFFFHSYFSFNGYIDKDKLIYELMEKPELINCVTTLAISDKQLINEKIFYKIKKLPNLKKLVLYVSSDNSYTEKERVVENLIILDKTSFLENIAIYSAKYLESKNDSRSIFTPCWQTNKDFYKELVAGICNFTNLKIFKLLFKYESEGTDIQELFPYIENCKILEKLYLKFVNLSKSDITSISKLKKLKVLSLRSCTLDFANDLNILYSKLDLDSLKLCNSEITHKSLLELEKLSNLKKLDLSNTFFFQKETFEKINQLPSLKRLNVLQKTKTYLNFENLNCDLEEFKASHPYG